MSYNITSANPVSFSTPNSSSVVSDLEGALMQNIGQSLQAGQSTNSGSLQQEMQLLTDLLNQSNSSQSNSGPASRSDSSTSNGTSSASSKQTSRSSDPSTATGDPTKNNGIAKPEKNLESALEQNMIDRMQNGQGQNNVSSLQQEMNLLIQLLGQGA
ncbi:MAG: hypothetical protein JO270_23600 [Acidobacteriaceae bacterium]|nr:hypothetical protein [Acidobacteriaceae bacterium]